MSIKVTTINGETHLLAVFCELTGLQICWRTQPTVNAVITLLAEPAYVSFDIVDQDGNVKQTEALLKCTTF